MGDYWLRHVRPAYTENIAADMDRATSELLQTYIGIDTTMWSPIAMQRLRLPVRMKGCGLRDATDRRHAQNVGVIVQSLLPLLVIRRLYNRSRMSVLHDSGLRDIVHKLGASAQLTIQIPHGRPNYVGHTQDDVNCHVELYTCKVHVHGTTICTRQMGTTIPT